jgi:adenine-specific DNA-methyltransferase
MPDDPRHPRPRRLQGDHPRGLRPEARPTLQVFATTLWEYPSQHYTRTNPPGKGLRAMQGDKDYVGATPSWIIWQLLQRYTRENDTIVDPMCGSGTSLDVCEDTGRKGLGFDLAPSRPDIRHADARKLPIPDASADFVFIDPPYSTHVDYSDDPRCIGKLDSGGDDDGAAYYKAMSQVIREIDRVLKDRRYMALYVSDSFKKRKGQPGGAFMPIGFELFALLRNHFKPIDIIAVVRHNQKLTKGNWRKAAEEGNFFLRGFNYLFIFKKELARA